MLALIFHFVKNTTRMLTEERTLVGVASMTICQTRLGGEAKRARILPIYLAVLAEWRQPPVAVLLLLVAHPPR